MRTILLVEDEPLIAEEISQTLRPAGYEVINGFNGSARDEASLVTSVSCIIERSHPKMVIMDINLAGKFDGVEVGRQLRERSGIPVIFLTGYSDSVTLTRAIDVSPSGYLIKPIAGRQLLAQVELTLRKSTESVEPQSGLWNLTLTDDKISASFNWLSQFRYLKDSIDSFESFRRIVHEADVKALSAFLKNCRAADKTGSQIEYRLINAEGHERWILTKILKVENGNGAIRISAINFDISEQKQRELLLQHRATHDALTDLCNRAYFTAELHRQGETQPKAASYGVLFADLDKFKPVNDEYGHATGDLLLIEVAQRFQRAVKKSDIVARFGGDEFVFLIRALKNEDDLRKISNRILRSLAEPIRIGDKVLKVGCSIGGATNTPYDKNPNLILHDADVALYAAKKSATNRFCLYEENERARIFAQLMTEESLRTAVKQDQFAPYFRPILNFTGKGGFAGFKIEMRWNHPVHGAIPFHAYRQAAEDSGLIVPVTFKIIEKTLDMLRGSDAARLGMLVTIPLNRRILLLRDWTAIAAMASEQYTEAGLELVFELDESVLERPATLGIIGQLHATGVEFSVALHSIPEDLTQISGAPFQLVSFAAEDKDQKKNQDFCARMKDAGKDTLVYGVSPENLQGLRHLCKYHMAHRVLPLVPAKPKKTNSMAEEP